MRSECLFCRIVARQSPADVEYEDDEILAFKDIYPKAPVHILIIPKRHIASLLTAESSDSAVLGRCLLVARRLGELKGFGERGYRVGLNSGPEGGQMVDHVHFHFLAGRRPTRK
jgi:histidine triad (HIT) family protein